MTLAAGTRLGFFEIQAPLGAGGMGEVYKAHDTRLDRIVAIKVLPAALASDPDRRERFHREAHAVAALNHPHICTLHDIGEHSGTTFLVMEYLEGETLAARLSKGALPLDQVLAHAIAIADALDAAHRQHIVHRDLKPGNVMLTKTGAKLLDFGLAKLRPTETGAVAGMSAAPTMSTPLTGHGTILGTLQYMAPEQVEGKEADARTDIFAFGEIVYEMATGKRAFEGKSHANLIAAILEHEPPPIAASQPLTPPALDRVVKKCLAKDPERRWQSASDLADELKWIADAGTQADIAAQQQAAQKGFLRNARLAWSLAALALIGLIVALAWNLRRPNAPAAAMPVSRLAVTLPPGDDMPSADPLSLALSPDGAQLVYVARRGGADRMMFLRAIDSLEGKPLAGTEGAQSPFFSPDGRWIGFFAGGKLKKIPASGGAPVVLCDAATNRGGAWAPNDVIFFAAGGSSPILQVSANGGTPQPFTTLDREKGEVSHRWPQVLPRGAAVLFTVWTGPGDDERHVHLQTLKGERRVLVRGGQTGLYVSTGHVIYYRRGMLMAVPFDLARRETADRPPVIVGEGIASGGEGAGYAISDAGVFAWVPGRPYNYDRTLVWVDRSGRVDPLPFPARAYRNPKLSPDGQRVAVTATEAQVDLWIYDLARGVASRLPADGSSQMPLWSPDGQRLAYRATRQGTRNIFWRMADGSGTEERLTKGEGMASPGDWSPDGATLAYTDSGLGTNDVWILDRRDGQARPFVRTRFDDRMPKFSPDGKWLAYASSESGRFEVYVQPYPGGGARWQISSDGGWEPMWNPNGRELFYRSMDGRRMSAVPVVTSPSFSAGRPTLLFNGPFEPSGTTEGNYDVSADGQRFLMVAGGGETVLRQINVELNWFEEVKRLMAAER